ncbi:hypothetical protein [Zarconia navalis]|nr:hypothetical protein [Zarconia navalis]
MKLLFLLQSKLRETELARQTSWHPLLFMAIELNDSTRKKSEI